MESDPYRQNDSNFQNINKGLFGENITSLDYLPYIHKIYDKLYNPYNVDKSFADILHKNNLPGKLYI